MRRWSAVNLSIKDVENLGTVLMFLCQKSGCALSANSAMFSNTQSLNLIQKPVTYVQRWRGVKKANSCRMLSVFCFLILKSRNQYYMYDFVTKHYRLYFYVYFVWTNKSTKMPKLSWRYYYIVSHVHPKCEWHAINSLLYRGILIQSQAFIYTHRGILSLYHRQLQNFWKLITVKVLLPKVHSLGHKRV